MQGSFERKGLLSIGKCFRLTLSYRASLLGLMAAAPIALWSMPTLAQEITGTTTTLESRCRLTPPGQMSEGERARGVLLLQCGDVGINLGEAESYRLFRNPPDGLMLVELERAGHLYVYLLADDPDNGVVVENVTGSLAREAGRTATSRIDNLVLDYSQVPANGQIAITGERVTDEAGNSTIVPMDRRLDARAMAGQARGRAARLRSPVHGGNS